ncbi:MAG: TIGR03118 family protein, partial [Candidatus Binatia bacterium]
MKTATIGALLLLFALPTPHLAQAQRFTQTNLISDLAGQALRTDANLVNPWGLAPGAAGVFWTANNETGTSTLYDPDGTIRPLVVTIPGGAPTGIVATAATDSAFDIPNGSTTARAAFIFVSLGGTISAWSPAVNPTNAITVSTDSGAVYTGAALGGTRANPLLYVADFKGGTIEAYDSSFAEVDLNGSFTDPNLPAAYFPFNVANVGGQMYVAYAQHNASGEELPGPGLGIVSVFDLQGNFVRRFTTGDQLNAPWAIVQAPAGFGQFGGDLLVGNFGDGRVLAYDLGSGAFQGALLDTVGHEIEIEGLWGLAFGRLASGTQVAQRLYFAAGIHDETHGLFGYIAEANSDSTETPVACDNESRGAGFWRKLCGGPLNAHGHGHGVIDDVVDHVNGNGKGKGHEHDDQKGHGPFGVDTDSLDALFACIKDGAAPNAFGVNGCFVAGCDLMRKVGRRSENERAAQVLLLTRLNLCSGSVCDSLAITCVDAQNGIEVLTLGEAADSLDALLCGSGNQSGIRHFVAA